MLVFPVIITETKEHPGGPGVIATVNAWKDPRWVTLDTGEMFLSPLKDIAFPPPENPLYVALASTKVQSVICFKTHFDSAAAARKWVGDHNFSTSKIDETGTSYRFRQFDPGDCSSQPRTITLTAGVSAIICVPK